MKISKRIVENRIWTSEVRPDAHHPADVIGKILGGGRRR
jgi:hypothetical protein